VAQVKPDPVDEFSLAPLPTLAALLPPWSCAVRVLALELVCVWVSAPPVALTSPSMDAPRMNLSTRLGVPPVPLQIAHPLGMLVFSQAMIVPIGRSIMLSSG
jgi:hypothetical protein